MSSKKWTKISLFILLNTFALLAVILYITDPLSVFHRSYFTDRVFIEKDMRKQAAGIINNFEFDSVILGTSMLENTSAFEASRKLNSNFVNISMAGSSFFEREIILSYLLKNRGIKTVIYSLDSHYQERTKEHKNILLNSYSFLYNNSKIDDIKLYFTTDAIRYFTKYALFAFSDQSHSLDMPSAWLNSKYEMDRFGGIANWFLAADNYQVKSVLSSIVETANNIENNSTISSENLAYKIEKTKEYVDQNILKFVYSYPNTKFILIFPPYSRIIYNEWKRYKTDYYEIHKWLIRYLVENSTIYNNIEIYGYEDQDFLDDIKNYKDPSHFHPKYNSIMLDDFSEKARLINIENVDQYINIAEEKAENYNIFEISNRIEEYLKTSNQ